jgi:hypothetical protein
VSIEEVRTLVAERQRYDEWLAALEARRDESPAHVYERVHADYLTRRTGVLARLQEHAPQLRARHDELLERVAGLQQAIGALEDEQAEALLRTAVGEFDNDRWEQLQRGVEERLGALIGEREGVQRDLDEVVELLGSVGAVPAPSEDAVAAPDATDAVIGVAIVDTELASALQPVPAEATEAAHAELAAPAATDEVIADVVGELVPATLETVNDGALDAVAAIEDPRLADAAAADFDAALDLLVPAESGSPPSDLDGLVPGAVLPPAVGDVFGNAAVPAASEPGMNSWSPAPASPGTVSSTDAAGTDGFDDLAFLRSVIDTDARATGELAGAKTDAAKTLRCTECGTMNFPTEWYCERCGGELAAF